STRTGGYILLQLLMDLVRLGRQANRVLCGPTNEVWIQPWLDYLRKRGVDYHTDAKVEQIHYQNGRIHRVTGPGDGSGRRGGGGGRGGGVVAAGGGRLLPRGPAGRSPRAERRPRRGDQGPAPAHRGDEAGRPEPAEPAQAPDGVDERHPVLSAA